MQSPVGKFTFLVILAVWFCALFVTCEKGKEPIPPDSGKEYLPLSVGKFVEYRVDSIIYDPIPQGIRVDTSSSYVREEQIELLENGQGETQVVIERSTRHSPDSAWIVTDHWQLTRNDDFAVRTEENLPFVILDFPIRSDKSWAGITFLNPNFSTEIAGERVEVFKGWMSQVISMAIPEIIGAFQFDDITTISHARHENLLELRMVTEKYARNIGLVFRELKILDTQCIQPCSGQSWEQKAERGFILRQAITDYN